MDAIVLESVSKIFRHRPALFNWLGHERGGETRALDGVSLKVQRGQVLAVLGPNGSGKTTLLKLIATILLPDSGRVMVEGFDTRKDPDSVRRHVGFAVTSERSFFPRLTARENLDFFAALDDVPRSERAGKIAWALGITGLSDAADTLAMKFSSGMYQRLGISRALLKRPSILVLDEPSRSLDPGGRAGLWNWLREVAGEHAAVIVATNNLDEAVAVAGSVAILRQGELVARRELGRSVGVLAGGPCCGQTQTSVEALRSFYFAEVQQPDLDLQPWGAQ